MIEQGKNAGECQRWAKDIDPAFTFSRATYYTHREHITSPLIPAAEAARRSPSIVPQTNVGVLEAIRNIGAQRALEHPEEVTVDHALKAASALEARKGGTDNWVILLAKAMQETPLLETEVVVGEFRDVTDDD